MKARLLTGTVLALLCTGVLSADTLYLRDGRRLDGRLIAVRDDDVEFEVVRNGPFGGRDRIHVDRDAVRSIDLDGARDDRDARDAPAARPRGLRERVVDVDSRRPWNDSSLDVRAGQVVYFTATGKVRWRDGRNDGPAGEKNSPDNPARPIPTRPAGSLIGRVGAGSDPFFIGDDQGPIRIRATGRLYLGINDDRWPENRGSFRVTVYC